MFTKTKTLPISSHFNKWKIQSKQQKVIRLISFKNVSIVFLCCYFIKKTMQNKLSSQLDSTAIQYINLNIVKRPTKDALDIELCFCFGFKVIRIEKTRKIFFSFMANLAWQRSPFTLFWLGIVFNFHGSEKLNWSFCVLKGSGSALRFVGLEQINKILNWCFHCNLMFQNKTIFKKEI